MPTRRRAPVRTPAFSVGTYLGDTLSAAGRGLVPYTVVSLLFHLPLFLLAWWLLAPLDPLSGQVDLAQLKRASDRQSAWNLVNTIGSLVLGSCAAAAISYGVIHRLRGEAAGVGACVSAALGRATTLFLTSLLLTVVVVLALMAVMLVVVAVLAGAAPAIAKGVADSDAGALTSFVVAMAVPSGLVLLFFFARYLVALPAVVMDRKGVGAALSESARLTAGSRLRIAVVVALYLLVGFALTLTVLTPILEDTRSGALAGQLLSALVHTPLTGCAAAVAYHRLKLHKDGVDVLKAAQVFE